MDSPDGAVLATVLRYYPIESVRDVLRAANDLGIEFLTLYAFSQQNWDRPKEEVAELMRLLEQYLETEEHHIWDCMLCGACSYVCPSNIPLSQMFGMAKYQLGRIRRKEDAA